MTPGQAAKSSGFWCKTSLSPFIRLGVRYATRIMTLRSVHRDGWKVSKSMKAVELLRSLNLGKSVAEFDEGLDRYFVDTETFRKLIRDDADIIAGDKGTGKTALYRTLCSRYTQIPELKKTEIVTGFNPQGSPVFQRLSQIPPLNEGEYIAIWKLYVFSLVGNWLLQLYDRNFTVKMVKLDEILNTCGLRSLDDAAQTIFSKLSNLLQRRFTPKSAELAVGFSESGYPQVIPKVEFGGESEVPSIIGDPTRVPCDDYLSLLDKTLAEEDLTTWVVLDRLDEAFQGFPNVEIPALRALFRTFLDMQAYPFCKLKIFVRRDVFRKIIKGGFVNLTHINARKLEIRWDEDDLRNLLIRRVRDSRDFAMALGITEESDETVFYKIFPDQVRQGEKQSKTWKWMMSRIRDGNDIKPPRNLIDLVEKAREAQIRSEERDPHDITLDLPIISADAITKAQRQLSETRVEDTLLAEAAELAPLIEKFRNGKAEHNIMSLAETLGVSAEDVKGTIKPLQELGFLEETGNTFKVPMLYRDSLRITQGKAFETNKPNEDEDE